MLGGGGGGGGGDSGGGGFELPSIGLPSIPNPLDMLGGGGDGGGGGSSGGGGFELPSIGTLDPEPDRHDHGIAKPAAIATSGDVL